MDPSAALTILTILAKYGPEAYAVARRILSKKEPTEADYAELDTILAKTGASYFEGPKVTT